MLLKQILKSRGITQKELANKLGISSEALRQRMNNPTYNSLVEIAKALPCETHELIETSDGFAHWYDNGEWLGIRRK